MHLNPESGSKLLEPLGIYAKYLNLTIYRRGEVAEWLNAPVLKTGERL